jgi:hypothetical protein
MIFLFFICVDDDNALESKSAEVEADIEKRKQAAPTNTKRPKRATTKVMNSGTASVRDIDVAVGARPSIPKELEKAHKKVQVENKKSKESLKTAQLSLDQTVLTRVKKSLFPDENGE